MIHTELVILPAGGLPPARTLITNFALSLFSVLDMLYIYILYIYIYIYICLYICTYAHSEQCEPGEAERILKSYVESYYLTGVFSFKGFVNIRRKIVRLTIEHLHELSKMFVIFPTFP